MRLGHEKARRREYRSLTGIAYDRRRSRSQKKARRKLYRQSLPFAHQPPKPEISRVILLIEGRDFSAKSCWLRTNNRWTCTQADPKVEWFRRVRNPQTVLDWINSKHFRYRWIKPHTEAQTAPIPATAPEPQNRTAQTYTLNKPASGAFHSNSATCLNSTPSGVHQTCSATSNGAGAEWLNQSSPLNCPATTPETKDQAQTLSH